LYDDDDDDDDDGNDDNDVLKIKKILINNLHRAHP